MDMLLHYRKERNLELTMPWLTRPYAFGRENGFTCAVDQDDAPRLLRENPLMFSEGQACEPDVPMPGTSTLPASIKVEFQGRTIDVPVKELAEYAFRSSGLSRDEWNCMDEAERNSLILDAAEVHVPEILARQEEYVAPKSESVPANTLILPEGCVSLNEGIAKVQAMDGAQCDEYAAVLGMDAFKDRTPVAPKRKAIIRQMQAMMA